jgi:LPXTG-site transpeptidase (sortase) family protein
MDNFKKFSKYFLFLFLFFFLVFNWSKISWVFNYQAVSGLFSQMFSESNSEENLDKKKITGEYFESENKIVIPRLDVTAPLLLAENSEPEELLDGGAVIFPDSVFPGEPGQTVILGHSAPPGWPKIKYEWVFSRLEELSEGNEIHVFFNNRKYVYLITNQKIINVGDDISQALTISENMLILVTCWPPGKDYKRLAVEAALKK